PPPRPTLFPYTTLFRSARTGDRRHGTRPWRHRLRNGRHRDRGRPAGLAPRRAPPFAAGRLRGRRVPGAEQVGTGSSEKPAVVAAGVGVGRPLGPGRILGEVVLPGVGAEPL